MGFFVIPQSWIGPAIAAAAIAFGPVDAKIHIHYRELPGRYLAGSRPPDDIALDKRPKSEWPKWKAQCVLAHEYGHLAGRRHSRRPQSLMFKSVGKHNCFPFLRRHNLR